MVAGIKCARPADGASRRLLALHRGGGALTVAEVNNPSFAGAA